VIAYYRTPNFQGVSSALENNFSIQALFKDLRTCTNPDYYTGFQPSWVAHQTMPIFLPGLKTSMYTEYISILWKKTPLKTR